MNISVNAFFEAVKGKTVAFIGIGTSNLPLIKLFADKGEEEVNNLKWENVAKKLKVIYEKTLRYE